MDKASGAFSGTGQGGSIKMTITGTASGDSVTLTTAYDGSSYSATFKGTLSADSKTMSGSWESNVGQKGTWTATRPSAPTPGGDPSNPNAPTPTRSAAPNRKRSPATSTSSDSSANGGAGAIYKVNPANGQSGLVHVGPPFIGIRGIAFGPEGNLFVTDVGAHAIRKIDLKTSAVTSVTAPLDPLLGVPWGIVYEPQLGEFLRHRCSAGDRSAGRPQNRRGETAGQRRWPGDAPRDHPRTRRRGLRQRLQIARRDPGRRRRRGGWKASIFKKGPFAALEGIATTGGGRFYVTDAIAPGGLSGATAVSGVGGLFSWLGGAAPELLFQPTTAAGVFLTPLGLAPSSDGKSLYIGSTGGLPNTGSVVEMDLATKKLKTLAGGFASPLSIAVAAPKQVEVKVDASGKGTTANANGVTTTVSSPAQPVAARVGVSVTVPSGFRPGAGASKAIQVKAVTKPVPAGKRTKVKVPFKQSLRKQIKSALRAGKKVKAKLTITATAANGSTRKVVERVAIKSGR